MKSVVKVNKGEALINDMLREREREMLVPEMKAYNAMQIILCKGDFRHFDIRHL